MELNACADKQKKNVLVDKKYYVKHESAITYVFFCFKVKLLNFY